MIADIMNKILLALFWVGTTLQNMVIWVWTKIKQALVWVVSKFINVCKCEK